MQPHPRLKVWWHQAIPVSLPTRRQFPQSAAKGDGLSNCFVGLVFQIAFRHAVVLVALGVDDANGEWIVDDECACAMRLFVNSILSL